MTGARLPSCAEAVASWLARLGCERVFLVPGARIDPLVAAVADGPVLPVVAQSELGAAFMADGHARRTGRPGACLMTGGPGTAYAAAGAITARLEGVPVAFVSGSPAADEGDGAFQDTGCDGWRDAAVMERAVDLSLEAGAPAALPAVLADAAARLAGRPAGPVHIVLPLDVQDAPAPAIAPPAAAPPSAAPFDAGALDGMASLRHPALVAGPAALAGGTPELLRAVAETYVLPVVTTFAAKGAIDEDHPLCLGPIGYGEGLHATRLLRRGDLGGLLALGADLSERDPNGRRPGPLPDLVLHATDPAAALAWMLENRDGRLRALAAGASARRAWIAGLRAGPGRRPCRPPEPGEAMAVDTLVTALRAAAPRDTVLFCDAGLFRPFVGHHWTTPFAGGFHAAPRTAPMGWAIAAGIGASLAHPHTPVLVVTGDGCMRMLGPELATAVRYGAPVTVVVSDNAMLGNVHLRARARTPGAAALSLLPRIDWVAFARSLGAAAVAADTPAAVADALAAARRIAGPFVIAVPTRADPFGADGVTAPPPP
ncbi:thiamine pyrophosphate-binding protein [Azospirillum halopraeferens]|uniref:thiamine pyrophosphate-binding protein n=1 Tax=Azospirillum halopraeferens TaxID=34010 RepID=UPI0003F764DC|nr:thiamine pyrophosphate-dependent enzyme [Azospirillum halopraeferens]